MRGFSHVTVLGAGISGLSAAWKLQERGIQTLVLEARPQVGGLAKTVHWNDFRFDVGPGHFFTRERLLLDEMKSLMGGPFQTRLRQHRVRMEGKWIPFPLTTRTLLRVPFSTLRGAVQEFVEVQAKALWQTPEEAPAIPSSSSPLSNPLLERLARRDLLEQTWKQSAAFFRPSWSTPDQPGVTQEKIQRNLLAQLFQPPQASTSTFHYPGAGMGSIAQQMKDRIEHLGGQVLTEARVKRILLDKGEVEAVHYSKQGDCLQHTDYVISTIPLQTLTTLLDPLPQHALIETSARLRYNSLLFLCLEMERSEVDTSCWYDFLDVPFFRASYALPVRPQQARRNRRSCLVVEWQVSGDSPLARASAEELLEICLPELEKAELTQRSEIRNIQLHREVYGAPIQGAHSQQHLRRLQGFLTGVRRLRSIGWQGKFESCRLSQAIRSGLETARILTDETPT